jgi:3-hydroxyisobutyrate dehydrogenase-like beta-hydroxyacid dehydrogenase
VSEELGFLGLGAMGAPIARRLAAAGYRLRAYDPDPMATRGILGHEGIELAPSAVAAAAADLVLTCLPRPDAVETVYGEIARPGLVACDLSTVGPSLARRLAMRLESTGGAYIESPMLGGVREAAEGTLFLVLSGAEAEIDRIGPVLAHFSRGCRRVGISGTASLFKTVQNGLGLVQLAGIAEALALLASAGARLESFIDVVNEGRGMAATPLFAAKAPAMLERDAPVIGALHIAAKDSGLAAALAREQGLELPLFAHSAALFQTAMEMGLGKSDLAALARVLEVETGTLVARRGDAEGATA